MIIMAYEWPYRRMTEDLKMEYWVTDLSKEWVYMQITGLRETERKIPIFEWDTIMYNWIMWVVRYCKHTASFRIQTESRGDNIWVWNSKKLSAIWTIVLISKW